MANFVGVKWLFGVLFLQRRVLMHFKSLVNIKLERVWLECRQKVVHRLLIVMSLLLDFSLFIQVLANLYPMVSLYLANSRPLFGGKL